MSTSVTKDYLPTIINSRPLLARLSIELRVLQEDLRSEWPTFRKHPVESTVQIIQKLIKRGRSVLLAPNVLASFGIVMVIVGIALLVDRGRPKTSENRNESVIAELTTLNLRHPDEQSNDNAIGRGGNGRVGFNHDNGEGSGEVRRNARGGGGSGNHDLLPHQVGKVPAPSTILAP